MSLNAEIFKQKSFTALLTVAGILIIVGVMLWQGVAAHGNPDPTTAGLSPSAMAVSSGVLVFREGLEAILVLSVVTAGLVRTSNKLWHAVISGALAALAATVGTWFAVVAILSSVSANELAIQAATGLLAVIVLLVVMNWFFHKIYWTGWISHHSERKKKLMSASNAPFLGLALLGFSAIYREGFEIVLFLQDLRLKAGSGIVLSGASIGLGLTMIVAALTFTAQQKLPYKKMLVATGGLLAVVLLVMIGESAQEMQQAGWISTTNLHVPIPDWMGIWFATFPTAEGLAAQAIALALVVGSYSWIRLQVLMNSKKPNKVLVPKMMTTTQPR